MTATAVRPHAVAFDVMETLMNLQPLRARFTDIGQPADLLQPWFLRFQRDAMALSLTGDFAGFAATARQALRVESGLTVGPDEIRHVLDGFAGLPAHGDAEPAVRALHEAGVRIGVLTVGAAEVTRAFLDRTGLARYVSTTVTAQDAGMWKPAAPVYHLTAERLGTPRERTAVVAVHAWDCHGAKRAGLLAGWCERLERDHGDVFAEPDVRGRDLPEVVGRLLALPAG